jgi:hypothetical protein
VTEGNPEIALILKSSGTAENGFVKQSLLPRLISVAIYGSERNSDCRYVRLSYCRYHRYSHLKVYSSFF